MKLTMSIPENLSGMGQILIEWAKGASRDFPWRHTTDPYSVLIAEKLLQQTAATDTVVRVFREILQKYPTPKELSGADIDQLEDLVRPLGLAYRAGSFAPLLSCWQRFSIARFHTIKHCSLRCQELDITPLGQC